MSEPTIQKAEELVSEVNSMFLTDVDSAQHAMYKLCEAIRLLCIAVKSMERAYDPPPAPPRVDRGARVRDGGNDPMSTTEREKAVRKLFDAFAEQIDHDGDNDALSDIGSCVEIAMRYAEALADLHAENYGVARDLPLPYLTAMETF